MSTPAEQCTATQHAQNLPAGNSARQDKICTVKDPFFGEDIPKPEGDPYDALLKPLLEEDSKQCDAWKDEVQNILIFAGLFSAVITAFIIESYQKLQADPNDQIVTLLARISDQLASSPNNTTPLSTPSTDTFTPLSSDIRVNIFWFISLVLSLTVALVGIITLQWLREHQRYDQRLEPMQAFAIFNARSEGLQRWYIPQIFAMLPLLIQSALALFFIGLIDFLFAIRIEVAIPVVVSISIPILFLVATTLLPTLQLYAMEFPHILSVNYSVPAPCPYKSPQSLISRRIAVLSRSFFHICACIFAAIYAPFVGVIRIFLTPEKPFYGELAPFHGNIDAGYKNCSSILRDFDGDWLVFDLFWLGTRTSYAIIVHTPDDFRDAHQLDPDLAVDSSGPSQYFYDCVRGMLWRGTYSTDDNTLYALHHCAEVLVGGLCSDWDTMIRRKVIDNLDHQRTLMHGRYMAIMEILLPKNHIPTHYFRASPGDMFPDKKTLYNAYCAGLMSSTQAYGMVPATLRKMSQRRIECHMRLVTTYLVENTQQLFECRSTDVLPPNLSTDNMYNWRRDIELYSSAWMNEMSQQWTLVLTKIIQNSLEIRSTTFGAPHVCSSSPPCGGDAENNNVKGLMKFILFFQVREDIKHTLQLLNHHCISTPNPIRDLPYVLVIACTYIDAVGAAGCWEGVAEFDSLLEIVSSICGHQTKSLAFDWFENADARLWEGLESALKYIRDNHTHPVLNTPKHEPLENSDLPILQQEFKAPDNV